MIPRQERRAPHQTPFSLAPREAHAAYMLPAAASIRLLSQVCTGQREAADGVARAHQGTLRDRKRLAAFPIPSVLRVLSYESAAIHHALYDAPNRIIGVDNHLNAIARI